MIGSPTWTRTRDLRINSPSLYRLSYQGMKRCSHDTVRLSRRVREWTHRTCSRKRPTSVGNVSKVRMIVILRCSVNLNQPFRIVLVPYWPILANRGI